MATLPLLSVQAIISQPPGVYETLRCVLLRSRARTVWKPFFTSSCSSSRKKGFLGAASGARAVCGCVVCMRAAYLRKPQELT
jgi:hypothetical protein